MQCHVDGNAQPAAEVKGMLGQVTENSTFATSNIFDAHSNTTTMIKSESTHYVSI